MATAISIPITHDEIPIRKIFDISGKNYIFEFNYNERFDFYTILIMDDDGNPLFSTKLCYDTNALHAVREGLDINFELRPLNEIDIAKEYPEINRIGKDNF